MWAMWWWIGCRKTSYTTGSAGQAYTTRQCGTGCTQPGSAGQGVERLPTHLPTQPSSAGQGVGRLPTQPSSAGQGVGRLPTQPSSAGQGVGRLPTCLRTQPSSAGQGVEDFLHNRAKCRKTSYTTEQSVGRLPTQLGSAGQGVGRLPTQPGKV